MPQKRSARKTERRAAARTDARLSMRLEGTPSDGQPARIVTESQNISASGVYCSSPHYLAPLSKVALTIVLPGQSGTLGPERLLKCEGVVVRCQGPLGAQRDRHYELACSFIGLEERYRRLIDDFVIWRNLQALNDAAVPMNRSVRGNSRGRSSAAAPASRTASAGRTAATSARRASAATGRTTTSRSPRPRAGRSAHDRPRTR